MMRESWKSACHDFATRLLAADPTYVGEWQSQKGVESANVTYEVLNATFEMPMPFGSGVAAAASVVGANLPWAEDHFQERVSGKPLNPPPSNAWWPFAQSGNALHKSEEKFSHTYPERYWPKHAGDWEASRGQMLAHWEGCEIEGVRFKYGDLEDVARLLARSPYTRQAFLPVWFPEDTGSVEGQRVPCTLGYQFIIRETPAGKVLHITYLMRSCDFMRHLADDIYMTIRLAQWMRQWLAITDPKFADMEMGKLHFHAGSLHVFEADRPALAAMHRRMTVDYTKRLSDYASGNGGPTTDEA